MDYLNILIELVIGYIALLIIVKCLGKTQISQITTFDFISALVLGDLVGSAVLDERVGLLKVLFSIGVWGALIFITEVLTQKSRHIRYLTEGRPSIIINQGKLDWNEMKRNRLDINQFKQLLRSKDIFLLQDVEYAILENDGKVSVLRKQESDQPTYQDLKVNEERRILPLTIISDGEIIFKNLQKAGLNEDWLYEQLKTQGANQPVEISYAEWQPGKPLYVQKY